MTDVPVWDNSTWAGFEPLSGETKADLCVVGLGGSGLAAVEEALDLGLDVVGVDAGVVAGEAAGRNGGFLLAGMPLFFHEAVERWPARADSVYRLSLEELDRIMGQATARQVGSIRVADSPEELSDIDSELSALKQHGFPVEPYEGPEGAGLLLPADGVCNPMARCRRLASTLSERGARLHEHTRATSIEAGRVVTTNGVVQAPMVVAAVDGRIERVFPELSDRVRTARLEMVATAPIERRSEHAVYTAFGYIYWQQLPTGEIALGGLRHRFAEHSWTMEPGPSQVLQEALDGYLAEMGVDAPVTHRWAGHAAYTPDRAPIYEEVRDGVWAIGGYCGHGNVLGSVYGRAAVRSAASGEQIQLL